ncbi:MAG: acyltransferase [Chitinophagales bacterium]|nr:acyltransferase [Chitinophagales bacterium]
MFRIWPLYFLLIGISLVIVLLKGEFTKYILARIIGLLAFSDNFMSVFYSNYVKMPYISHLWTITYEEQFYIFVPFLILLLIRFSARTKFLTLLFTLALFNLIRLIFIQHNVPFKTIWVLPITNFESIILGIVMGFGGYDILLKRFKPVQIFIISIGFFLLLNFIPPRTIVSNWLILSYLFTALFSTLLIFSVVHSQQLKSFFSKHIFVYLGKRSYGLYMYHLLGNGVASLLIKKVSFMPSNLLASFLYSISFTIIVSIISYKYFETPFLKLKKRFEVIISRPI